MLPDSSASLTAEPPESLTHSTLASTPAALRVLLDELLVLRHVEQQVDDAELLGDADLAFGVRSEAAGEKAEAGDERGGFADEAVH